MLPYKTVFTRQALDFLVSASVEEMAEVEHWVERIERLPSALGDFAEQDQDGRDLQVLALATVVVTYWADDAMREVRIVGVESLRRSR